MSSIADSPLSQKPLLPEWFDSEPGRELLSEQKSRLAKLVPDQFYRVGLQYGLCEHAILDGLNVEQALYCDKGVSRGAQSALSGLALPEALPFPENSVDLAVMLHTLDYCEYPHAVLREIAQTLSPEGVLLVSGFHPYSLWGVERKLTPSEPPFNARFISRAVIQDWLELLGFQSLTGGMLNYQLPKLSQGWRRRLEWMNSAGDRWWPTLGAVYLMVFQKKIYSGLGVKQSRRQHRIWFPELKPASARVGDKLAHKNRSGNC